MRDRAQEAWDELANADEVEFGVQFPTSAHDGFIAGYLMACKDFVATTFVTNHPGEFSSEKLLEALEHPLAQDQGVSVTTHRLLAVENTYYGELLENAGTDE